MEEIDLYDLLRFYAKKWLTIATFVMLGGIAGVAYTYFVQSPQYTSKATILLVGTNRTSSASDSVTLNNYVQLFTSRRVLEPVITEHDYNKGYDTLVANTTAQNTKNTDIINVSISTSDAKQSKALLEDGIQSFRKQARELYGDNTIKINIVDAASLPGQPTNVKPAMQIGLAVAAGFALGIISLFFMYDYRMSAGRRRRAQRQGDSSVVIEEPRSQATVAPLVDSAPLASEAPEGSQAVKKPRNKKSKKSKKQS
ncbi:hypothetical protein I8H84_03465 [Candidatus Saccharibacteria bacterium]|nr:hypothetical protein [Candidatus Saccharibacteria bacterium]MBH1973004.1 hypothetical protein [Candidatus Saccharibacteria bacterium]MBH1991207.1 hypothetical protein [Candidatus Saccharibacteria bacterium]